MTRKVLNLVNTLRDIEKLWVPPQSILSSLKNTSSKRNDFSCKMLRVRSLSLGAFGAARDGGLDLKGSVFPLFCAALFRQGTADGGVLYSASWAVWLLLFSIL